MSSGRVMATDRFLEEIEHDWELVQVLYPQFQQSAQQALLALEKGMEAADADGVMRAAHMLKGMVGNFFADELFAVALAVETQAKAGRLEDLNEKISSIKQLVSKLDSELNELVGRADKQ